LIRNFIRPLVALLVAALAAPLAAQAMAPGVFDGRVVHVSVNNIKVHARDGQELSFLVLPHFHKIFHSDGKTTADMSLIKVGDRVAVYYDQKALGARHADRIIDESAPLEPLKN
jgi:NADPH:quinone reductase-like Zn-dependent oxidoreductase